MEAWILHIRTESIDSSGKTYIHDAYTAWSTEKQAWKEVTKYLLSATEHSWSGPFKDHFDLRLAIKALVESEKLQEAIALIHIYSGATSPIDSAGNLGSNGSSKVTIKVTQSKFLGSVWE